MKHIAVLGAGITGVTTAYELVDRGFQVTVYDRQRYAGMETSFANGGQLSACNAETWTTWATVLKGLRWMVRRDAPLLVNPRPSWHKISWMAEFLAAIPNYRANTIETARLAQAARPVLFEMAARAGIDFDHGKRGILHIYRDPRAFAAGSRVDALYAEAGLTRVRLDADAVAEREPQLAGRFAGGFWTESDSTGDIHKFTAGLADWLSGRGMTFRYGTEIASAVAGDEGVTVQTVDGDTARYDGVIVAAGTASRAFAKGFGDRVNVYPVKGYSVTVELRDATSRRSAPMVSIVDDAAKIVTSRLGADRFRIAGTAEFNGENRDIRADRIRPLVDWCQANFPQVSTEHVVPWAGLRPMMPDMMPRVGRGRHPRVFYNTGHGHLGWTLAGATAELVAETVAGAYPDAKLHQSAALAAE